MYENLYDTICQATGWARIVVERLDNLRIAADEMDADDPTKVAYDYALLQVLPEATNVSVLLSRAYSDLVTLRTSLERLKELAARQ